MLQTSFLEKAFATPLVLASGVLGVTAASLYRATRNGCGGVTIKSLSKEPRTGHPNPTMLGEKTYFLNAVGLSNPGIAEGVKEIHAFKKMTDAPLIGSVFAGTADEFAEAATMIADSPIDFLEVDISCPNVGHEFGDPFAYSAKAIETITKKIKAVVKMPVIMKLSPNAWNIAELAKAAEAAGADAITAVNTVSGMAIDVRARMPILHNKQGGISGPALFPIALNCVYQIYKAVKIPIIGTGGVTTGENALAMIMAGATLVGVGSAVYYRGETAFQQINDELTSIMTEERIDSLADVRGIAHRTS